MAEHGPTQPESSPLAGRAVVEEVIRRYEAGEPIDELFAPGYRRALNSPAALMGVDARGTADDHVAAMDAEGMRVTVRSITDAPDDRYLLENVWIHRGDGGAGSSGRFWTLVTVRDGLVAGEEHFAGEAEARARSGLG